MITEDVSQPNMTRLWFSFSLFISFPALCDQILFLFQAIVMYLVSICTCTGRNVFLHTMMSLWTLLGLSVGVCLCRWTWVNHSDV